MPTKEAITQRRAMLNDIKKKKELSLATRTVANTGQILSFLGLAIAAAGLLMALCLGLATGFVPVWALIMCCCAPFFPLGMVMTNHSVRLPVRKTQLSDWDCARCGRKHSNKIENRMCPYGAPPLGEKVEDPSYELLDEISDVFAAEATCPKCHTTGYHFVRPPKLAHTEAEIEAAGLKALRASENRWAIPSKAEVLDEIRDKCSPEEFKQAEALYEEMRAEITADIKAKAAGELTLPEAEYDVIRICEVKECAYEWGQHTRTW